MIDRPVAPKARPASFEDYAQIADLEARYGLSPRSHDEWIHLWKNNPAYQHAPDWPIGWVLENPDGKLVGYLGNIPLSYELNQKRLRAATSRSWVVEPRYRSYAILLLDYFFGQKGVDLYLTTTLNADAFAAYQFFEPRPVPVGRWDEASFWITQYRGFVASSLICKGLISAGPVVCALSLPLYLADRIKGRRAVDKQAGTEVTRCPQFDERFDDFWEELRRTRPDVLMGVRTREILNWHFNTALANRHVWIVTATSRSRLMGYAIFYRQDTPRFGLTRVRLADFQTLYENYSLLSSMSSWAIEECRNQGIHMLEMNGLRPEKMQVINQLTPHRRKFRSWLSFYKTNDPYLAESLRDSRVWDFSCFDGDASL
jgi:hypothetical protein